MPIPGVGSGSALCVWWKNHVSRLLIIFLRVNARRVNAIPTNAERTLYGCGRGKANALRAWATLFRVKAHRTPACCAHRSGHAQHVSGLRQIHRGSPCITSRAAARDAPSRCALASGQRTRGSRLLRATVRVAARSVPGSCGRPPGYSAFVSGLVRVALRVAARRPSPCAIPLMSRVFLAPGNFHAWLFPAQAPFTPRTSALTKTHQEQTP